MHRLHIDAKDDLILRLAHRDQPVQAVIELIWNSLDAEADNVNVVIERNAMDGVERVRVEDNGHGMAPEAIPSASFQHLGGSSKATAKLSPNIKRQMNGRNGQGRCPRGKALATAAPRPELAPVHGTRAGMGTAGRRKLRIEDQGRPSFPGGQGQAKTSAMSIQPALQERLPPGSEPSSQQDAGSWAFGE